MEIVILLVIAAVLVLGMIYVAGRKRKHDELRHRFGPEYDRTVHELGGHKQAETELEARRKRVEELNIRPLSADTQTRFADQWRATQARFVDDPKGAIHEADRLVNDLMQTRGYPMGDFEQRAADISVNHADVVTNYRAAHRIAESSDAGKADTENLRTAMVHYRALFEELLEAPINLAERREERYRARAS